MLSFPHPKEGKLTVCEGPGADRKSHKIAIQLQDGLAS